MKWTQLGAHIGTPEAHDMHNNKGHTGGSQSSAATTVEAADLSPLQVRHKYGGVLLTTEQQAKQRQQSSLMEL